MTDRGNKRILPGGRSNPRLGKPNEVTYDRGIGFTSSARADRELVAALEKCKEKGSISDDEQRLLDALKQKRRT